MRPTFAFTVIAFFGPNAAGKTTVLRAVASTIDFALHSFSLAPDASIPYFQPFRSASWLNRSTRIVIDFDASWMGGTSHVYRYQATVGHGQQRAAERVIAEALSIRNGRRFRAVFRRDERGIRCAPELDLPPSDSRLKAVRANASLISTMAQLNHPMFRSAWEDIALTQGNIRGLQLTPPDINAALRFLYEREEARIDLRTQLSRLDLGLQDIEIESTPQVYSRASHEGLDRPVLLAEESNGTQRFLAMFPSLWFTLQTGRPALVDEFDVDLHPLLIPELLKWFQDPEINHNKAQLFLAAHNVAIMEHLEKEEIFLVGKSSDGASSVIPLRSILGLRREPSLQRKYLGGMLGAVPNIG